MLTGRGEKPPEVFECAEFRVDGLMAALRRSNGPRTAHIVLLDNSGIVFASSKRMSDRMDRGKVDHVESHRGNIRKPCLAIPEGPVTSNLRRTGPGKDLVPRREAR